MLQGDAEYFGLLLTKSGDPQSYSNGHKRSILLQCTMKSPNFCVPRTVSQLWNWLQIISNGQIMLCEKISVIFQSNAPCTCTLCTFWGLGITPETPSGGHASLATTQKSQRVTLINLNMSFGIFKTIFLVSNVNIRYFSKIRQICQAS